MYNHLEQLVAEWYEYQGYFVRRNINVGLRKNKGGYECELDVVAFNPETKHLAHIEPSYDADSWKIREKRFRLKFDTGREHIPKLFCGLDIPSEIEQIALFGFASTKNHQTIGGGRIMLVRDLLQLILEGLKGKKIAKEAVPEQYPLLRTLQLVGEYRMTVMEIYQS